MRVNTDENLPPDVAELLRDHGYDASTVWDQQLRGQPDERIAAVCRDEGRVIVTLDEDFADIRRYPPGTDRLRRASGDQALPFATGWSTFIRVML